MSNTKVSSGIGFPGMLTILFIGLKLTNFIDWSWWWVLSPLWIGFALIAAIFLVLVLAFLIIGLAEKSEPKRTKTKFRGL